MLGGDCSNIIGIMLALRRAGRYGLFFIDGHSDFYQPEAEPNGEVASMDLAIVSGRGPAVLTDIDGSHRSCVMKTSWRSAFATPKNQESTAVRTSGKPGYTLSTSTRCASWGPPLPPASGGILRRNGVEGFWIHVDADVLDDAVMPAVEYHLRAG